IVLDRVDDRLVAGDAVGRGIAAAVEEVALALDLQVAAELDVVGLQTVADVAAEPAEHQDRQHADDHREHRRERAAAVAHQVAQRERERADQRADHRTSSAWPARRASGAMRSPGTPDASRRSTPASRPSWIITASSASASSLGSCDEITN